MDDVSEIPLSSRKYPGLVALVDADDAEMVGAHRWHPHVQTGVGHHNTYAWAHVQKPDGRRSTIRLHTLLTGWSLVDHVDGDGLNNRRANLRPATVSQNGGNMRSRTGASKYKGVHALGRGRSGWQAMICTTYLGQFSDEVAAARAYDAAAIEKWGDYALLNFPGEK